MNQATVDRALRALAKVNAPQMPEGVQLLSWKLRRPPVILSRLTVVNDVAEYVHATLDELDVALHQRHDTMAVRECLDRLEQCGVVVKIA